MTDLHNKVIEISLLDHAQAKEILKAAAAMSPASDDPTTPSAEIAALTKYCQSEHARLSASIEAVGRALQFRAADVETELRDRICILEDRVAVLMELVAGKRKRTTAR